MLVVFVGGWSSPAEKPAPLPKTEAKAAAENPPSPGAALSPVEGIWTDAARPAPDALQHYVAPEGKAENLGTGESPWDLAGTLSGQHSVAPGSVVWVRGGKYVYPVRDSVDGANGFLVSLGGAPGQPVHLRTFPCERATIDGGFNVNASHLWIWDLEFAIGDDWRPKEPSPQGQGTHFNNPSGVLNVVGKEDVRLINCISHHNIFGIGFWKWVKNGEIHGCILFDNGFLGTDRPHGPAIYSQNQTQTPRLVTDNILAGNFSLPLQIYGSDMGLMVNDFLLEGNILWGPRKEADGRTYALCGGGSSSNIVVRENFVYGHQLRVGKDSNQVVERNMVVRGGFSAPFPEKNTLIPSPSEGVAPVVMLRPNKYDPRRAHLVASNWGKAERMTVDLSPFIGKGDKYRILSPFDFYGKPLAEGVSDGSLISLPLPPIPWELMVGDPREIGVYVIMKGAL